MLCRLGPLRNEVIGTDFGKTNSHVPVTEGKAVNQLLPTPFWHEISIDRLFIFHEICCRNLMLDNTLLDGGTTPRVKICDFRYSKVIFFAYYVICNPIQSWSALIRCWIFLVFRASRAHGYIEIWKTREVHM
jgi:hypothetical protein